MSSTYISISWHYNHELNGTNCNIATDTHSHVAGYYTHIAPKGYGPKVFILQFQYPIQGGGLKTTTQLSHQGGKKLYNTLEIGRKGRQGEDNCLLVTSVKMKHIINLLTVQMGVIPWQFLEQRQFGTRT